MTTPSTDPSSDPSVNLFSIERSVVVEPSDTGLQLGVISRIAIAASAADLWRSLTDADQLRRWFLPVTGELRVGGAFAAEGNASGAVLRCDTNERLRVTWGDESSVVDVRLVPDAPGQTSVDVKHTYPLSLAGNGTGAFYVGPGWDFALNALRAFHSSTPLIALNTPQEQAFNRQALLAWGLVVEGSGTATPEEVAVGITETLPQWAPDLA
jgi:uncharacterized protein YndB with AHSA1/START domain